MKELRCGQAISRRGFYILDDWLQRSLWRIEWLLCPDLVNMLIESSPPEKMGHLSPCACFGRRDSCDRVPGEVWLESTLV